MKEYETKKGFKVQEFDNTLSLTDCLSKRGYYRFLVYDTTRGMNIGASDKNDIEAMFDAIKYYQKRLIEVERELHSLEEKVNKFLNSFSQEENNNMPWEE